MPLKKLSVQNYYRYKLGIKYMDNDFCIVQTKTLIVFKTTKIIHKFDNIVDAIDKIKAIQS